MEDIEPSNSIEDVKNRIFQIKNIPVDEQRLIFSGKCLADEISLGEYGIQSGSILHLILRLHKPCAETATKLSDAEAEMTHSKRLYADSILPELSKMRCTPPLHSNDMHNSTVSNNRPSDVGSSLTYARHAINNLCFSKVSVIELCSFSFILPPGHLRRELHGNDAISR